MDIYVIYVYICIGKTYMYMYMCIYKYTYMTYICWYNIDIYDTYIHIQTYAQGSDLTLVHILFACAQFLSQYTRQKQKTASGWSKPRRNKHKCAGTDTRTHTHAHTSLCLLATLVYHMLYKPHSSMSRFATLSLVSDDLLPPLYNASEATTL